MVWLWRFSPSFRVFYLFNSFDVSDRDIVYKNYLHYVKQSIRPNRSLFGKLFDYIIQTGMITIFRREMAPVEPKKKKGLSFTFPWWCLFIAYGISLIFAAISMFFIIARGIEFGDLKTQKWLASLLSGFFSSILLIQPLKVHR